MDYRKITPSLALELADAGDLDRARFDVFVRTEDLPRPRLTVLLESLGAETPTPAEGGVLHLNLSGRAIERLSDQPEVRSIEAAGRSRLLAEQV